MLLDSVPATALEATVLVCAHLVEKLGQAGAGRDPGTTSFGLLIEDALTPTSGVGAVSAFHRTWDTVCNAVGIRRGFSGAWQSVATCGDTS